MAGARRFRMIPDESEDCHHADFISERVGGVSCGQSGWTFIFQKLTFDDSSVLIERFGDLASIEKAVARSVASNTLLSTNDASEPADSELLSRRELVKSTTYGSAGLCMIGS